MGKLVSDAIYLTVSTVGTATLDLIDAPLTGVSNRVLELGDAAAFFSLGCSFRNAFPIALSETTFLSTCGCVDTQFARFNAC